MNMNIKFLIRQLKEQIFYQASFLWGLITGKKESIATYMLSGTIYLDTDVISLDKYLVKSNKWGLFKIPNKRKQEYQQAINERGWAFQTPQRNYGVIGYPSVTFQDNPIKIENIWDYDILFELNPKFQRNRKYNTSFDFWIGTEPKFSFPIITHEIMMWEDYNVAMPFGKFVEEIFIFGVLYRVYTGYIDKSSENLGVDGWMYTAFLRVGRLGKSKVSILRVQDFLTYLLDNKIIEGDEYLLRSEIGNEVYNASGRMEILHLSTSINGENIIQIG